MRNFESNFSGQADERNTGWDSIGDEDLARRRAERASRRYEAMQKSESAKVSMMNKAKALAAGALLAVAVVGGVAAGGCSTHEIMDTERAETVETINVESVTVMNGPNIRKDPDIPNHNKDLTVIMDFGEEGQAAQVAYRGTAYYYHDEYSLDGDWYGFPAEEFANELFKEAFIDQKEVDQLVEKDSDGVIWINDKYVTVDQEETISNANGI